MSAQERESEDPKVQNIIDEIEEDIQRERLNKIWERYGNHFIAIAIAIVVGTGAAVTWKNWVQKRNAENTAIFITALDTAQAGNSGDAMAALSAIAQNAPAAQAALADIRLAGLKLGQDDLTGAVSLYDKVAADGALSVPYRDLATFLSVQAQADTGDASALLARLAPLMDVENPWRGLARELGASINLRTGDKAAARDLLSANLDDEDVSAMIRGRDEAILKNME